MEKYPAVFVSKAGEAMTTHTASGTSTRLENFHHKSEPERNCCYVDTKGTHSEKHIRNLEMETHLQEEFSEYRAHTTAKGRPYK